MFTEDLSAMFAPGALGIESVSIAGTPLHGMVDRGTQLIDGVLLSGEVSLLLPAAWVPAAAEGQAVQLADGPHHIRQVLGEPPDAVLVRLILVKD